MNLLSGVKDWFSLGIWLGVPIPRLHDIEHNFPGDENLQRRLSEVVITWINACPEKATWTTLVEALTEMGQRKTAQEVAEKRGLFTMHAILLNSVLFTSCFRNYSAWSL